MLVVAFNVMDILKNIDPSIISNRSLRLGVKPKASQNKQFPIVEIYMESLFVSTTEDLLDTRYHTRRSMYKVA